ncbi:MAG TPA: sulfatase-like hydrolase/transferase, partial [Acidobacteriaceae bacterium]|nr:sulfatase-like hydrolase/transferase [Acidobacteriaceae bacterium]
GVAGWWNPYCRDFASVLAECSWRAGSTPMETIGASSQSVTANALVLPEYLLARVGLAQPTYRQTDRRHNIADYLSLMSSARGLIQNQQIHFVFLHLPVPHPPGIYDRRSHRLRAGGNYLDNLTLADDTLGELMQEIAASAEADRTTVVVSSDHSWRVPLWENGPAWTKEEEEVSHGSFDPRPVFLIHFPDQAKGAEVHTQVPELEEHEIIAAILNRHIENEAQLAALLGSDKITLAGNEEIRPESGQ